MFDEEDEQMKLIIAVPSSIKEMNVCIYLNESNNTYGFLYYIPDIREGIEGGVLHTINQFKNTNKFRHFKSNRELNKAYNFVKNKILELNPTYRLIYEGRVNCNSLGEMGWIS